MFATIGHTIDLMKMSWRVLMLDRELILFPVMSVAALVAVAGAVAAGGLLSGASGLAEEGGEGSAGDLALGLLLAFVSMAIVIFFNSALVAAAMERLRGGDPNVASGLKAASARIPQILAWAVVVTVVMLILRALRNRGGIAGQIAAMFGEAAWELASFFAVPFIVEEGVGPFEALRRSRIPPSPNLGPADNGWIRLWPPDHCCGRCRRARCFAARRHSPLRRPRYRHSARWPRVGHRHRPRRHFQGCPLTTTPPAGNPTASTRHPSRTPTNPRPAAVCGASSERGATLRGARPELAGPGPRPAPRHPR